MPQLNAVKKRKMKKINIVIPLLIFIFGCSGNPPVQKKISGVVLPRDTIQIEVSKGKNETYKTVNGLIRINDTLCISPKLPIPSDLYKVDGNKIDVYIEEDSLLPNSQDKIWWAKNGKTHVIIRSIEVRKNPYNATQLIWGWVQMLIAIGAILIMIIVWNEHDKRQKEINKSQEDENDNKSSQDLGVFYLSAAFILWSSIGVITTYASTSPYYLAIIKFLSFTNNFFFLLSFPYFNHGISYYKSNKAKYLILNLSIFILFLMLLIGGLIKENKDFVNNLDAVFSCSTLIVFGIILCNSFAKRKLIGISVIAGIWTLGALFTQVSDLIPGLSLVADNWDKVIYFASFVLIIILITALIFSWYHEQTKGEINKSFINLANKISTENDPHKRKEIMLELVNENQFPELFAVLLYENKSNERMTNEVTHLSSRYTDLMNRYYKGSLSTDEYDKGLNRIREAVIELIHRTFNNK
jgi:hypothetical protein